MPSPRPQREHAPAGPDRVAPARVGRAEWRRPGVWGLRMFLVLADL